MRDPHARNLRAHRIVGADVVYSVTATTRARGAVLDDSAAQRIVESIQWLRRNERALIFGFVVMPDHVHVLLLPRRGTLPDVMRSFKGFTGRAIQMLSGSERTLWQPGYFDHAIASPAEAWGAKRYIEDNPVRAGIVERASEYRFSSANPAMHGDVDRVE